MKYLMLRPTKQRRGLSWLMDRQVQQYKKAEGSTRLTGWLFLGLAFWSRVWLAWISLCIYNPGAPGHNLEVLVRTTDLLRLRNGLIPIRRKKILYLKVDCNVDELVGLMLDWQAIRMIQKSVLSIRLLGIRKF